MTLKDRILLKQFIHIKYFSDSFFITLPSAAFIAEAIPFAIFYGLYENILNDF
jgi:hypothetical protein